jgi:hypothetical protein
VKKDETFDDYIRINKTMKIDQIHMIWS